MSDALSLVLDRRVRLAPRLDLGILEWPTSEERISHGGTVGRYDLPIHPAYACLGGGTWDRERLRVSALGRTRGQGMGRWEWEHRYYRDEMRGLERMAEERLR